MGRVTGRVERVFGRDSGLSDTWEYRWESSWPDELCDNGTDDDSNGLTDCADPDCEGKPCAGGVYSGGVCQ